MPSVIINPTRCNVVVSCGIVAIDFVMKLTGALSSCWQQNVSQIVRQEHGGTLRGSQDPLRLVLKCVPGCQL